MNVYINCKYYENTYFDRTDVSEGNDVNKTRKSKRLRYLSLLVFFKQRV